MVLAKTASVICVSLRRARSGVIPALGSSLALSFLCALAGCAGDPDVEGTRLGLETSVAAAAWRGAPAGCEDVPPEGHSLAACEGEPGLLALLDPHGRVRCVDATLLLLPFARTGIGPTAGDPSPQPNRPPPPGSSVAVVEPGAP